KGFDSIKDPETDEVKYDEKDIHRVYHAVISRIEKTYGENDKINIEDIQDLIEEELHKKHFDDVAKSFSEYRERRNLSREMFFEDKKRHKFLKTLEGLGLKTAHEEDL